MKKAFTLIELMVSIVILSILMLFLYQSYAGLNKSNEVIGTKVNEFEHLVLVKKTVYLDFYTSKYTKMKILKQDQDEDVVYIQTKNSLHQMFAPYVAYVVKNEILYRLESLNEFRKYPFEAQSNFLVDRLGKVRIFRIYKSKNDEKSMVMIHIVFQNKDEVLLKVPVLNQ
jgi:prepilin-type N-terminal cleavage/methylation domain-containing protein